MRMQVTNSSKQRVRRGPAKVGRTCLRLRAQMDLEEWTGRVQSTGMVSHRYPRTRGEGARMVPLRALTPTGGGGEPQGDLVPLRMMHTAARTEGWAVATQVSTEGITQDRRTKVNGGTWTSPSCGALRPCNTMPTLPCA